MKLMLITQNDPFYLHDALDYFYSVVKETMNNHIPNRQKKMEKSSLPWLNEKCRSAIACKHLAEGTSDYMRMSDRCHDIIHSVPFYSINPLQSFID